jgi:hypothetical protein
MSSVKTNWSDVVAGRNISGRRKYATINQTLEPNITSPYTEDQWKTVNTRRKKSPTVSHASYYQIPVIVNQYDLLSNRGRDNRMVHKPLETQELKLRNEGRRYIQKETNHRKRKRNTGS